MSATIVWFRRDLRLTDNPALAAAAERGPVIPLFVWAPEAGLALRFCASTRTALPAKMILSGGTPAARARRNSPSETTSIPVPSAAMVFRTA